MSEQTRAKPTPDGPRTSAAHVNGFGPDRNAVKAADTATDSTPKKAGDTFTCKVWREGKVVQEDFPFHELSDKLGEESSLVWMDVQAPDHHRLQELADELSLDPNAIEDAVSAQERPKTTRYAEHTFVTAYAAHLSKDSAELQTPRISAFLVGNALITVRNSDEFDMHPVVARWHENAKLLKHGVHGLMHGLLDVIVDSHFDAVQKMDDQLEDLEDSLFDEKPLSRQVQRAAFERRKALVALRRIVLPMREVVSGLMRQLDPKDAELMSYYQDLYDHVLRASEWTESLRDMVSTIFETNLSLSDTRMNEIMKKLTSWAAIIAVPTAVTGFFGQNVPYPGFGHWSGFLVSSLIIVLLAGGLYIGFRRREWL
jgi:magnesium transporter